ncbi:MAG: hypothetical protein DI586_05130 [Micavibrio aeruginosavorus]|uniref:Organic solvent tolerance-like N-terminal domain-containing protein n=1 Tax=Micavibrio aeruginosavorus TaxID=349221 RepID=A0A2W5HQI8_9BACT|nr:MAG: hypothetical protein DI586_05130 [Micavibrio aeruginosavorus]
MRYLFLILLSCIAANAAQADVIATDGAVIVNGNQRSDSGDSSRFISNDRNIQIYTGGNTQGQAFIMRDGKLERLSDGDYTLPSGRKVNIKNGRMNAQFGDKPLDSDVKILPPGQQIP